MKCLLIPIIVGLISALLGYLLGTATKSKDSDAIAKLKAALDACKKAQTNSSTKASSGVAFDAQAAKAVFGKTVKHNDLTVVEGIGPKIQELFRKNGVDTWKALAECSVEKCQQTLDKGGENFKLHNPKTWPKQAQLAYEGKWQKLFDWQEELDGGV